MELKTLISKYLDEHYMMQLATVNDGTPWCCTVYYIVDDKLNLYWLSLPSRRHSKELELNNQVAAAIPINFVKGEPVIGIQVQGIGIKIEASENTQQLAENYASKFNRSAEWVDDFCNNKTVHTLYKLTPREYVIFDEINFPKEPRQIYLPSKM